MADEALLESPEEVEVETESTDGSEETGADSAETRTEAQTDTAPVISDANGQLKLSQTAREQLDKIKAENPRLARDIRAALFDRQALLAKVPGGVKDALTQIEAYEAEGGSEAVQKVKQELGRWKDLDADFQAGKREFVDDIAAGNPDAFLKAAPNVMAKFAELSPEHFSHHISKVFAQDMAANDVAMNMRLLQREIGLLPEANRPAVQGLWDALAGYVDRINGLAKTAPKVEVKAAVATPQAQTEDNSFTVEQFAWEKTKVKESVTKSEFEKNVGTRRLPVEKISTIQELYENALHRMVTSIPGHTAKVDRFLAAKDKTGYRKHMEAAIRSKAPEAMAAAFRKAGVGAKPGPVAKPAAKAASATATTVTTGFVRSATKPDHNAVNWQATARITGKKGGDGKFIMRDGSKVLYTR